MRILTADNLGNLTGELDPSRVFSLTSTEEINGERSLTIETSHVLAKQSYVLFRDAWDEWREYVILGVEESHADSDLTINTYYAVWSLQYELMGTVLKSQPGKNSPVSATAALTAALAGSRWSVGTVQPTTTGGTSFYYLNGWEALGKVIETWGGELDVTITVGETEVSGRAVDLLDHLGTTSISRKRFEFGQNVEKIARIEEDAPYYCRVIPRGSAIESDSGGYGRKVGIASVNPTGMEYLEDSTMVDSLRIPDGNGGYIYPTTVVDYEDIDDAQVLYDTALADLHNHTRPLVSYEAGVLDFVGAGLTDRLQLGDNVQVIDKTLSGGTRISARVVVMDIDHLEPRNNRATIGYQRDGFPSQFENLQQTTAELGQWRDLLQGALAADDTGNLIATADLTVNGAITGESFNLWHGQRTLSSADNIDQLFESGIYYLPGSVPSGTYPSGFNAAYTSLLSIGNNNETSGGWVGKQILVGGVAGVWYRSYAGSPRAWSDWTSLDESRHPTEIAASSLTLTGCSLNGASTIPAYKIGRHVTINMRVNVTAANPTIAGFPATSGANSHIPVIAYRQSDNAAIAGYLTNAGVVTFPALASGSNIMLHAEYIASS